MDKTVIVEDCFKAGLLAEHAAVAATRMLGLVLAIVRNILEASDAAQAACVPEPMVRDVVNFAAFVITSGAPDLFAASKDLHTSMIVRGTLSLFSSCTFPKFWAQISEFSGQLG